jgi:hypothetical protein
MASSATRDVVRLHPRPRLRGSPTRVHLDPTADLKRQ